MSTPTSGSVANGRLSPADVISSTVVVQRIRSDSDGSDARDNYGDRPSPSPELVRDNDATPGVLDDDQQQMSESEESDGHGASDDADFDMHDSPPSQPDEAQPTRASSVESQRAPKRKAPAAEDEFIKANPELYGLRRSVRPIFGLECNR